MEKQVTICARSPLGTWLALLLVTGVLLLLGLHLATDGAFFAKIPPVFDGPVVLGSRQMQNRAQQNVQDMLTGISDHIKKYDRPQRITYFGVAIFGGFILIGVFGWIIRSYRFRFIPDKEGQGVIERRSMWIFIPLVWIARVWKKIWTWIPVRALRTLAFR